MKRAGETDDQEEYDRLCRLLPMDPDLANTFKRYAGIEGIIASGMNVIEAVEKYGEAWLQD